MPDMLNHGMGILFYIPFLLKVIIYTLGLDFSVILTDRL
jgi:hypothetical protein